MSGLFFFSCIVSFFGVGTRFSFYLRTCFQLVIFFPIMLLFCHCIFAINICSPKVSQHTSQGGDCPWRADPQLLKMALSTYPKLKFALFPPSGPFGMGLSDVSIYHLMQVLQANHKQMCQPVCIWCTGYSFSLLSALIHRKILVKCYKLLTVIDSTFNGRVSSVGSYCVC